MADSNEEKKGGFLKAIVSSILGMLGGAALMYISPLVNNAIKPPRPFPNFSFTLDGATATFNNRSTGGTQGWWDFGDGSALEPFSPNQATMVHRFPATGSYTVKLSLQNILGEEAERSAPVRIDSAASTPSIDDFSVTPVTAGRGSSQNPTAPATYRVTARIKNADLLLWSVDEQPLEIFSDLAPAGGAIEHYVTFPTYGPKKIRLMAVTGRNKVEQQADVWVDVPNDEPSVLVRQISYAVANRSMPVSVSFPAQHNGPVYPFEVSRKLAIDGVIVEATMDRPDSQLVREPKLVINADKKSFTLTGDLLRSAVGGLPPSWFTKIDLKVAAKDGQGAKRTHPVSTALKLPGRTTVPLPPTNGMSAGVEWELRNGMDVVAQDAKTPSNQVVRFKDRTYRVTVTQVGSQVQIDAVEAGGPFYQTSTPRRP